MTFLRTQKTKRAAMTQGLSLTAWIAPILTCIASPAFARQDAPSEPPAIETPAAPTYRVVGVGDIMMGSDWPLPQMDWRIVPGASPAEVLGPEISALFQTADILFGNYEGTIHTASDGAKSCKNPEVCFTFRSPPFHAAYLAEAGFDMMSNANNHARDFGEGGRSATYATLTSAGIAVSSADRDGMRFALKTLADGTRVSLVAFGHNPNLMPVQDLARVAELVREADSMADFTIVSCHVGAEGSTRQNVTRQTEMFLDENRGNPWAFAHAAIDAGGDIILCHGPHVPRAIEVYKGRFIAYSLGNFWTYGRFNLSGPNGLAPIVDLSVDKNGALRAARIVSARQHKPGGPSYDPTHLAAATIARLTASDIPEAGISISESGEISWPGKPLTESQTALKGFAPPLQERR